MIIKETTKVLEEKPAKGPLHPPQKLTWYTLESKPDLRGVRPAIADWVMERPTERGRRVVETEEKGSSERHFCVAVWEK